MRVAKCFVLIAAALACLPAAAGVTVIDPPIGSKALAELPAPMHAHVLDVKVGKGEFSRTAIGDYVVFSQTFESDTAESIGLRLVGMSLPEGSALVLSHGGAERPLPSSWSERSSVWLPALRPGTTLSVQVPKTYSDVARFSVGAVEFEPASNSAKAPNPGVGPINYSCVSTPSLDLSAKSVVNVRIAKREVTLVCSGVLLNNASVDFRALVMGAAHCEDDPEMLDNNEVELDTTEYRLFTFNGQAECGAAEFEVAAFGPQVMDASVVGVAGDTILYDLSAPVEPRFDAQFAGWNRSSAGAGPSGAGRATAAYSIHHMSNRPRQWFRDTDGFLEASARPRYDCTDVSNGCFLWTAIAEDSAQDGQIGPGSSGAPLFDGDGRVVGELEGGGGGEIPGGIGGGFRALASLWVDDLDGARAIVSALDPTASGVVTLDSVALPPVPAPTVTLLANPSSVTAGDSVRLSWTSENADACFSSGDWAGNRPTNGQTDLVLDEEGTSEFTLSCSGIGGESQMTVSVDVLSPTPTPTPTPSPTASPGGGSGGGAGEFVWLLLLPALVRVRSHFARTSKGV